MNGREILLVAAAGALGAVARYGANLAFSAQFGDRFPWGTLFVNVLGCFLLGWLVRSDSLWSEPTKLALGTGFLGAFTTFSTFGVQTQLLWNRSPLLAFANVSGNIVIGLLAAGVGLYGASKWAG